MASGDDALLHLSFGPNSNTDDIYMAKYDIIERLKQVTKIESQYFAIQSVTDLNVLGETYYQSTWNFTNNLKTRAKLLALKKMLDYDDGEQFKTLFNVWSEWNDFHVIDVSGLDGIAEQNGVLDLAIQPQWNIDNVLGLGVLQAKDGVTDSNRTFCPHSVCPN